MPITDPNVFVNFANGTFEDPIPAVAYPQDPASDGYIAFNCAIERSNTFVNSGIYALRMYNMNTGKPLKPSEQVSPQLSLYTGKDLLASRKYTPGLFIRFVPGPNYTAGDDITLRVKFLGATIKNVDIPIADLIGGFVDVTTYGDLSQTLGPVGVVPGDVAHIRIVFIVGTTAIGYPSANVLSGASVYVDSIAIEEFSNDPLAATFSQTNTSASGASDGSISVFPTGGSGVYTYLWDDGPTTQNRTGLPAGQYVVTITDTGTSETVQLAITIVDPTIPEPEGTFIDVPSMNSLHFVNDPLSVTDSCSNIQGLDNRLLKDQEIYRFNDATEYSQKVCKCDAITTQFYSDYGDFTITLHDYKTDEIVKTFGYLLKEQNIGKTEDYGITIRDHTGNPGQSRVYFTVGALPIPISVGDTFNVINNGNGYNGGYQVAAIINDATLGYQYLVINKQFVGPGTYVNATGRFVIQSVSFNVFESAHDFTDVEEGCYYIRIFATQNSNSNVAISEPIDLRVSHPSTNLLEGRNENNEYDITWTTGYVIRMRVESRFYKRKPGGTKKTLRNADYSLLKTSAKKSRVIEFETGYIPPYLHEKLSTFFDLDYPFINKIQVQSANEYEEPDYLEGTLLSTSTIDVEQVGWYDKYNNAGISTIDDGGFIEVESGSYLKR